MSILLPKVPPDQDLRYRVVPQSGQKWDVILFPLSATLEISFGVPSTISHAITIGIRKYGIPDSNLKFVSGTITLLL